MRSYHYTLLFAVAILGGSATFWLAAGNPAGGAVLATLAIVATVLLVFSLVTSVIEAIEKSSEK